MKIKGKNYTIYLDNCNKVLDDMIAKGEIVDHIICDPPYGNVTNAWKEKSSVKRSVAQGNLANMDWEYLDFNLLFSKFDKITKQGSRIILFCQFPLTYDLLKIAFEPQKKRWFTFNQMAYWKKSHFSSPLRVKKTLVSIVEHILIFKKIHDSNLLSPARDWIKQIKLLNDPKINKILNQRKFARYRNETSLHFSRLSKELFNEINPWLPKELNFVDYEKYKNFADKYRINNSFNYPGKPIKDVFEYSKNSSTSVHPTQKPIELMRKLIKTFTNKNEIILDFTMGSGSTGHAALLEGRKFIGIENDKMYFTIAKNRLNNILIDPLRYKNYEELNKDDQQLTIDHLLKNE